MKAFKWFAKYWLLKYKYEELEKKYNELVQSVDPNFREVITDENLCSAD